MNQKEEKPNQDDQSPEESSQSRGDLGCSNRGLTEHPVKVDRGSVLGFSTATEC